MLIISEMYFIYFALRETNYTYVKIMDHLIQLISLMNIQTTWGNSIIILHLINWQFVRSGEG